MGRGVVAWFVLAASLLQAAPHRVLLVTATFGFRHDDAIDAAAEVFQQIAKDSGVLEIVRTEDVSLINADNLRGYDAIYFYTSGEMPLSDQQKADLLDFVRQGKGFGASHSATDCNYSWPDYGDMIGGYFDGHPWTQEASVDVEDTQSPLVAHAAPSFRFTEEFYQFRSFSRERVRVLLTLDTRSVDMGAAGINRTDGDFPLAWIRNYGKGRVFYSAFGHFADSFRLAPVRTMLGKALLWLTGEIEADAAVRGGTPAVSSVRDLAGNGEAFAPGGLVKITGERLTSGSSWDAASIPLPLRLAGTHVEVNGLAAPLFSLAPGSLLLQLPTGLVAGQAASLVVSSVNAASAAVPLRIEAAAPAIVGAVRANGAVVLYVTGLGTAIPVVLVNGQSVPVFFFGLTPGFVGLYQVNALVGSGRLEIAVQAGGRTSNVVVVE